MEQTGFIAAIDFGSSKIKVMVGKKNREGKLLILDKEEIESGPCIRRGRIYNLEDVQKKVRTIVLKLEQRLPQKIEKMYVGVGGQSLQTKLCPVPKDYTNEGGKIITEELIQSLRKDWKSYEQDAEILDIASVAYYLDDSDRPETNPIGMTCSSLEAHFKLIMANPVKGRAADSLEKARVNVAGYLITPIATANAVLSVEDKKNGCALVEIGAEITYVSIYKQGMLKELITIPLGGNVITSDIASQKISLEEAEKLKIKYGSAIADPDEGMEKLPIVIPEYNGPKEIERSLLDDIVEARVCEIIANVEHFIHRSEYGKFLNAGIFLTGGGALLNKMTAAFRNKFTKSDVIRLARPNPQHFQKMEEQYDHPAYAGIIGILLAGTENCAKEKEVLISPNIFPEGEIAIRTKKEPDPIKEDDPKKKTGTRKQGTKKPGPKKPGTMQLVINFFGNMVDKGTKVLYEDAEFNNNSEEEEEEEEN